jgi:hypothetical protein
MATSVDVFLGVVLSGTAAILLAVAVGGWRRMRTRRSLALLAGFAAFCAKGLVVLGLLLSGVVSVPFVTYILALDCAIVLLLYAGVAVREVRPDGGPAEP